jgi:hypothetical protein
VHLLQSLTEYQEEFFEKNSKEKNSTEKEKEKQLKRAASLTSKSFFELRAASASNADKTSKPPTASPTTKESQPAEPVVIFQ